MGMYTEIYINTFLGYDIPENFGEVFTYLFDREKYCEEKGISYADSFQEKNQPPLPEHDFFKKERWTHIGSGCSYYHIPFVTNNFRKIRIHKEPFSYYVTSRSDIKNYDYEIESFFDWIKPYCVGFIGYYRYEEDIEPTLVYSERRSDMSWC